MNSRRKNSDAEDVEELLRVAEDEVLLKLSLNSHLKSDRAIDTDLDNRFKSLKSGSSKPKSNPKPKRNQSSSSSSSSSSEVLPNLPPPPTVTGNFDGDNETPDVDSLLARFNALKATLPSNSVSSASAIAGNRTEKNRISEEDEEEEDDVEKVIKWAIDAARLDPSPCSDEDEDEEGDSHSDDDDDTDDEEDFRKVKHKAGKKK